MPQKTPQSVRYFRAFFSTNRCALLDDREVSLQPRQRHKELNDEPLSLICSQRLRKTNDDTASLQSDQ